MFVKGQICFALAGLAAPLGILGADAGAGYGRQEPRVTSRLLSLRSLRDGRCPAGASRPSLAYVTLRYGIEWSRNVTGWQARAASDYASAPLSVNVKGHPTRRSLLNLKLKRAASVSPTTPPLKPKAARRAAPQGECDSTRPITEIDIRKPKRGVLVTPPSSMTWRNGE